MIVKGNPVNVVGRVSKVDVSETVDENCDVQVNRKREGGGDFRQTTIFEEFIEVYINF